MKSSELYEFTNKELRDILKKNQVKNYSKMNKKDLIKKVNQLTNSQNGGNGDQYTEVSGVKIPIHMLSSQRYPPPPYPPPNAQRYPPQPNAPPLPPQSGPRNAAQNRFKCPSPGWAQQRNDCWIDSAYYAMFVPSNLQDWFITFFSNISTSQNEELRKFSELSLEYLQGIDGNPAFLSKKQNFKRLILRSIKAACERINPDLFNVISAQAAVSNLFASSGIANTQGNGDISIFFKFISKIQPRLIYLDMPYWKNLLKHSNGNKVIQKYIRDELGKITDESRIDIIAINASYLKPSLNKPIRNEVQLCMNDNTVLQEILNIGNFSLEALIRGDDVHYRVDFRCSDNNWYNYDNDRKPNHIMEITAGTRNWKRQDGLIFIFRRRP